MLRAPEAAFPSVTGAAQANRKVRPQMVPQIRSSRRWAWLIARQVVGAAGVKVVMLALPIVLRQRSLWCQNRKRPAAMSAC